MSATAASDPTVLNAFLRDLTRSDERRRRARAWEDLCTLVATCEAAQMPQPDVILYARRATEVICDLLDQIDELVEVVGEDQ